MYMEAAIELTADSMVKQMLELEVKWNVTDPLAWRWIKELRNYIRGGKGEKGEGVNAHYD